MINGQTDLMFTHWFSSSNTSLHIFQSVIPAKAGIQSKKTGFRVRPGMTSNVMGFIM
jgi:hypothetical protein